MIIRDIGDAKLHSEFIRQLCGLSASPPAVIDYEMNNPDHHHYLPAQTNNEGRVGDTQDHSRFSNYPLNTRFHWHQYSSFKDKYGLAKIPGKAKTVARWGRAHNEAYMKCLAEALAIPALALKVDSLEVCQAVHVDSSAKVWVSEAKGTLAKFGSLSLDNILNDRTLSEQSLINIERAIEEITAELFHQYLTGSTTQEGVQSWLVDRSLEVVDRELANLPH